MTTEVTAALARLPRMALAAATAAALLASSAAAVGHPAQVPAIPDLPAVNADVSLSSFGWFGWNGMQAIDPGEFSIHDLIVFDGSHVPIVQELIDAVVNPGGIFSELSANLPLIEGLIMSPLWGLMEVPLTALHVVSLIDPSLSWMETGLAGIETDAVHLMGDIPLIGAPMETGMEYADEGLQWIIGGVLDPVPNLPATIGELGGGILFGGVGSLVGSLVGGVLDLGGLLGPGGLLDNAFGWL